MLSSGNGRGCKAPAGNTNNVEFLSVRALAERWAVSIEKVKLLTRDGSLRVLRIGRSVRVPLSEVLRYERAHTS